MQGKELETVSFIKRNEANGSNNELMLCDDIRSLEVRFRVSCNDKGKITFRSFTEHRARVKTHLPTLRLPIKNLMKFNSKVRCEHDFFTESFRNETCLQCRQVSHRHITKQNRLFLFLTDIYNREHQRGLRDSRSAVINSQ